MKLFYIFSSIVGVATTTNAALPPGYEDDLFCPPDNCQIYTCRCYEFIQPMLQSWYRWDYKRCLDWEQNRCKKL